jgi:hypothetical protein
MDERVECYSGMEYAERPERIFRQGEWLRIREIRAERRLPGGKEFEVETEDGDAYSLTYDSGADRWTVRPAARRHR